MASPSEPFRQLLQNPLLQGLTQSDLLQFAESIPLHFFSCKAGAAICEQDAAAEALFLLLSGRTQTEITSPDRTFSLVEFPSALSVLGLQSMFGMQQTYTHTVKAFDTAVEVLSIPKSFVRDVMLKHPIVLLNVMNLLSHTLQRTHVVLWRPTASSVAGRLASFISTRALTPAGEKILYIKRENLAHLLGASSRKLVSTIEKLQGAQLLTPLRGRLHIAHFEKFSAAVNAKPL